MEPDDPRRGRGPGRVPADRQGRRPPPRRTAPGRWGARRGPDPSRRASRPQRPVPPPRTPPEDDPGHRGLPGTGDATGPQAAPGFPGAPGGGPRPHRGPAHGPEPGYGEQGYYGEHGYEDEPGYDEAYHEAPAGAPPDAAERGPGKKPGKKKPGTRKQGRKPKKGRGPGTGPLGASKRPRPPERPGGRPRPARRGAGPGPKLYYGAAAVLGLVVLLGLGAFVVLNGGDSSGRDGASGARGGAPASTGLSPASYSSSASTSAYAGIASRDTDPQPLTIDEVFPSSAAKVSLPDGDVQVKLRAKRLDDDCAAAVWGQTVGDVLSRGGCTQAARGIYADTKNGYGLAVAVFNLSGSKAADEFVATLEKTIGAGFVQPLPAEEPLDDFGRGFGMARGLAMGHFAVVTWAQRLDGKGDVKDETLLELLIEGGKNPAVLGRAARASN
ncbi:MAG TPA: hypothetical protein VIL71_15900 [Spirillospora sp.]